MAELEIGEKIVIFGAGKYGHLAARMLKYQKEIIYIVDNDS